MRCSGWSSGLALASWLLLIPGCATRDPESDHVEPPIGRWPLVSIDGSITIAQGGAPVVCPTGESTIGPAPLYDGGFDNRSHIQLLRLSLDFEASSQPPFVFDFLFEQNGYRDHYSNGVANRDTFRGRWPEVPTSLRVSGLWNWIPSELRASVSSGAPIADRDAELKSDPDPAEPWLYFGVEGRFLSATEIEGTWSYAEDTELGGCWSRGEGSGTWLARYLEEEDDEPVRR